MSNQYDYPDLLAGDSGSVESWCGWGVMKQPQGLDAIDLFTVFLWPLFVIVPLVFLKTEMLHWFLIPHYFCGVLLGGDASRWIRGKYDLYDVKGIIGMAGCFMFLPASLLLAYYSPELIDSRVTMGDWRPWLGYMAALNMGGLVLYQYFSGVGFRRPVRVMRTYWAVNEGRAMVYVPLLLVVTAASHVIYLAKSGGFAGLAGLKEYGYIQGYTGGYGPIMVIGRSLPMVFFMGLTLWCFRRLGRTASNFTVAGLLMLFVLFQFITSGFSGSRSSIVWGLFWAAGIIHFFWRQIPTRWAVYSIVPFLLFSFFYSFYKDAGAQAFEIFKGRSIQSLSEQTGRTFEGMLVGDLGRADAQAGILKVLVEKPWEYRYRYGSTYITSVTPYIPRRLWPGKPTDSGKVIAGTEILYGPDSYAARSVFGSATRATRIYGLAGEAMLNFGVFGILPAFAVWGYFVGRIRRRIQSYLYKDARLLTAPYTVLLGLMMMFHDMANLFAVTLFTWVIPAVFVYLIADKVPIEQLYRENIAEEDPVFES